MPEEIRSFRDYQKGISFGQAPYDAIGSEVSMQWDLLFYKLFGDQGSVDRYAAALDQVMPDAIRKDLRAEMRNAMLRVKPQDAMIVAWAEMADDSPSGKRAGGRQDDMESGQTMSEGLALRMKLTLDSTVNPAP